MIRYFKLRYLSFLWLSDLLSVNLSLLFASYLRTHIALGAPGANEVFAIPPIILIVASAIWLIALNITNTYRPANNVRAWHELRCVIAGHGLACLLFLGVLYLTYRDLSRLEVAYFVGLALTGLVSYRLIVRVLYSVFRLPRSTQQRIIIIGTDTNAKRIAQTILHYHWIGMQFVGFIDVSGAESQNDKVIGTLNSLLDMIAQFHVNEVIISVGDDRYLLAQIMELLHQQPVNIRLAPDYSEFAYFHVHTEDFGGLPLVGLREEIITPFQRFIKRLLDVILASAILIIGWPFMLIIGMAIRLESRGPAIYAQPRVGERGSLFHMYKFRSMYIDGPPQPSKTADDPRITTVGRFLRRTSLDELPQFVNVLLGDMSLVGPRPELTDMVDKYEPWQRKRFEVPQGMTGWWQINGRADRPMHMHTEDDLFYIRHYSLWLDAQIILRTILVVILGRGAY